ncbi:hypothetical protein [Xanthomarina sp. F2636L]|uniref:hypothetical protein n=1 Tax=Xanthomarina sp. F2636L TaxID=2996018 RepID=UPI00225E049B|nr:hypothetical protein [Xanthomarina sp. F2636L]MCX7550794.1 hypothetical protein [Xanthomarina sp. F2636L]
MKSLILTFTLLLGVFSLHAQTDQEIGSIYINKAEESFKEDNMDAARDYFRKARLYIKEIDDSKVARIGALLSDNIGDYQKAQILTKRYFDLEPDKSSDEYLEMLELYVSIEEALEAKKIAYVEAQEELLRVENEKRRIDSITDLWTQKSEAFFIEIDSIGTFNKYNLAVYKVNDNLGLMDHFGNVIIEANTYKSAMDYDGYVLLMDNKEKPTRLYCYNATTKEGYQLPSVTQFNPQAYHYGKVMLPRTNGLLVAYPNNVSNVLVFDLNTQKFQEGFDKKEYLKTLKKNDIIEKYNSDLQIKIDKNWYELGDALGGGIHPLFHHNKIYGFLNTFNGNIYTSDYYSHFGAFCSGKFQIIENENHLWMDVDGLKFEENSNESGSYTGNTNFVKDSNGKYKILQEVDGKKVLVYGDQQLPMLNDYLTKYSNK